MLLITFIVYFSQQKNDCNVINYDAFYLIKSLRINEAKLCEKIFTKTYKERCLAGVKNSDVFCSTISAKQDSFCLALAKKDSRLCKGNAVCHALLTKDADSCIKEAGALNITAGQVVRMKKICTAYAQDNAEFFISKDILKKC